MIEVFERQLHKASEVDYLRPIWPVKHVTIAIPAYNEERFIGSVVIQALRRAKDVIVIDDGSNDATAFIAEQAGAMVLHHVVNMGKTEAVNTALSWARQHGSDVLVFIDGDGQHNPEEIERVVGPVISGQADMVVGSRFLEVKSDIPFYRRIGQHALTRVTNMASATPTTDSQSGFRAFSRRAIELLHFRGTGLSVESEMQFQAREHGLSITEVPISVVYAEKAKRNPFSHGMQIITNILQLVGQHRPLFFFGFLGLIFLAIGSFLGVVTIDAYMSAHVLAVGYALISVLTLMVGTVSLFVGLILHSVHSSFEELKQTLVRERAFEGQ